MFIEELYYSVINFIVESIEWVNRFVYINFWSIMFGLMIGIIICLAFKIIYINFRVEFIGNKLKFLKYKLEYKEYILVDEYINLVINSVVIAIVALIFNTFSDKSRKVLDIIFYNYIPLTYLITFICFIVYSLLLYRKYFKNVLNNFLKYVINITYFFMFISALNEAKFVLMSFIGVVFIINLRDITGLLDNNKNKQTNELYVKRQKQLEIFNDIINEREYSNYAVALCGEWGSGKSEFLNKYIYEYRNENYFIFIKPMITDTVDSLVNQFTNQLIKIMKENRVYTGKKNIDRYFKEILKTFQISSKVSLDSFMQIEEKVETFLDLKGNLQKDISSLNKHKKVVLVVDDFDRIDEDKQEIILHFIKEVIDFKGCTTIFALDLSNILSNKKINEEYLEKFIDRKVDLCRLNFEDLLELHKDKILNIDIIKDEKVKEIILEIKNNITKYNEKYTQRFNAWSERKNENNKKIKDENEQNIEKYKTQEVVEYNINIQKKGHNSRRVIHFLNSIKDTISIIDKLYPSYAGGIRLLESIKSSEIVYVFNYLKIFNPEVYHDILKSGGIEEFKRYLENKIITKEKNTEIVLEYINIMFEGVLTREKLLWEDEKASVKRRNENLFVNDIFIDYNFTVEKIDLLTKSQRYLDILDSDSEGIAKIDLGILQEAINRDMENVPKRTTIDRIDKFIRVAINECINSRLKVKELFSFVRIKSYYEKKIEYLQHYLEPIILGIDERLIRLKQDDISYINSVLDDLVLYNILKYQWIFREYLLLISYKKKLKDKAKLEEDFNSVMYLKDLIDTCKKYLIQYELIESNKEILSIKDIFKLIQENINVDDFDIINIKLLEDEYKKFKVNMSLIERCRSMYSLMDEIEEFEITNEELEYAINDISDINKRLNQLIDLNTLKNKEIWYFKKLIVIINNNYYDDLNEEIKEKCVVIFNKINKDDRLDLNLYMFIAYNVQKIKDKREF